MNTALLERDTEASLGPCGGRGVIFDQRTSAFASLRIVAAGRPADIIARRGGDEPIRPQPIHPRAYDGRAERFWRWFTVAWLAAGYVLTGVAYFLG